MKLFLLSLLMIGSFSRSAAGTNVTSLVNPFVGTDAHGHTFPGATFPFGMVQLSPDTRVEGWDACAGYHYSDSTILGFSHTHLSGTGVADYGDILIMPFTGTISSPAVRSRFSHTEESASPGYYRVLLKDFAINAELTTTKRTGVHRYTFPRSKESGVIINLQHGLGPDRVIESQVTITGKSEVSGYRRSEGWAKDQHLFFVARFSKPFQHHGIFVNDSLIDGKRSAEGTNLKALLRFATKNNERVIVKVGISSVSIEGARKNLDAELPDWNFDAARQGAESAWRNELSKIMIEGGSNEQRRTFYTALYHTMIAPNLFSDVDGGYRGMDGTIRKAEGFEMYTVFSLWDTFRALHPLLSIIDRKRTRDFVQSLLAKYDEGGVLPVWELAGNETWCMIGYHSVPVILDAYMKGIRGFDTAKAFAAMKHSASLNHFGLKHYRAHGYIPAQHDAESVSKTLEYAYNDWCIAQMAKVLGSERDYEEFIRRAQYFENVFDTSTGFMRAKQNGAWVMPFDPTSVTLHYTEANAWQYNFFVPHNVTRLINLHGGRTNFIRNLDTLFFTSRPVTGRKQADVTGLIGQYAHGNEPSHHIAYLYNYAGSPWKTQNIVRLIMEFLYNDKPDGLSGNDDCGQMSAWYVMSAVGFYQVAPGQPVYTFGSPIFPKAVMHLENGKSFTISAPNTSSQRRFIAAAELNGMPHTRSFITHEELAGGGNLTFTMNERPQTSVGENPEDYPRSIPQPGITAVPFVKADRFSFTDSMTISLGTITKDAAILYTLDGSTPSLNSLIYTSPVTMRDSAIVRALAFHPDLGESSVMTASFPKVKKAGRLTLATRYSSQYTGGGDDALIDGLRGGQDFRLGAWQGYYGHDLDAVLDLGMVKRIASVSLGCLQDNNSWIFFPTEVEFSFSNDGKYFSDTVVVPNAVSPRDEGAILKEFAVTLSGQPARYIRVRAGNVGTCPDWHKGAGNKAWLFVDEITVNTQ